MILARVLHDWDDAAALRILRHARRALPPGGQLFVVEMILPEGGSTGGLCDLHLLAVTGGRERTVSEYVALLDVVRLLKFIDFSGLLAERESPAILLSKVPHRLAKYLLIRSFSRYINAAFVS